MHRNVIKKLSKSKSFELFFFLCNFLLLQQVVILSSSIKGTFKDQELSTEDSSEQSALSMTMLTYAKLRLVLLADFPFS